jgi:hypothetical protein
MKKERLQAGYLGWIRTAEINYHLRRVAVSGSFRVSKDNKYNLLKIFDLDREVISIWSFHGFVFSFSVSLKLLQWEREEIENERDRIFASCYGKLTTSGLCSFEFVPILHATLLHVLCVISLSLTGTSIARKFSPGFTLSSSKVNVASRVLGALNSSFSIWPMSRLGKTIP